MKTVNVSLKDIDHQKLLTIRKLLDLPNLHETIASMITYTFDRVTKETGDADD